MQVHRILRGAGAGTWLPFAMSRLRALRSQSSDNESGGYFTQQYIINGTRIRVSQNPFWATISIVAGGGPFYMEYQTSGFPVVTYTNANLGQLYEAATISVSADTTGVAKSHYLGGTRVDNTGATLPLKRAQQVQLLDEPVHYPLKVGKIYDRALYEAWAPGNPHTGIHQTSYHAEFIPWQAELGRTGVVSHFTRDVLYDVGYADGSAKKNVRYAYLNGVDWPRSSGIRTVVDPAYGTREFAVYVDAFDQVSIFPTAEITSLSTDGSGNPIQNVDVAYVQTARVAFPAWVYAKTEKFLTFLAAHPGDTGLPDFPEYDWKLHPDGTKMCAVVYEREEAVFDNTFYSAFNHAPDGTNGYQFFLPTPTSWALLNTQIMGIYAQQGVIGSTPAPTYLNATGIIEVPINVTLSGVLPEDFTLSLGTPTEVRRPTTSELCAMLVGYSWHDIPAANSTKLLPTFDAHRGDMVALDIEVHGRPSDGITPDLNGDFVGDTMQFLSLKNLTAATELRTFVAENAVKSTGNALVTNATARVLAADMQTLSFAILHPWDEQHEIRDGAPMPPDPPGEQHVDLTGDIRTRVGHFGVGVYTLNRHRSTLYPDTIDVSARGVIDAQVASDGRTVMNAIFGPLPIMPVNDMRGWADPDMSSLREDYDTAELFHGVPVAGPPTADLLSNPFIHEFGMRYQETARVHAAASLTAKDWWYNCIPQGNLSATPWPLFNLVTPRPGWYQYMGQLMRRNQISPYTTFFAHPNGSWALFNQEFIYNKGGSGERYNGTYWGDCQVPLNTTALEHCILDSIVVTGANPASMSFIGTYNNAVTRGPLTDAAGVIAKTNMRATFSTDTVADLYDGTVVYTSLKINWQGYTARITDHAYFTGTKTASGGGLAPSFDPIEGGQLHLMSLSAYWTDVAVTKFLVPQADSTNFPATFSSVVMIDG